MKIYAQNRRTVNLQELPKEILNSIGQLGINTITFVENESAMTPSYYVITLSDNSLNRGQIGKIASMSSNWDVHISSMANRLTITCFGNGSNNAQTGNPATG